MFEEYNREVQQWLQDFRQKAQATAEGMGIQHRENSPSPKPSLDQIKERTRYESGVISMVGIRFPRSLIWPHKGAGKGMGGDIGSSWIDAAGVKKSTDPDSKGKAGTGSRQPKEWLNESVEGSSGVEHLADIVAEKLGDTIINNLLIK